MNDRFDSPSRPGFGGPTPATPDIPSTPPSRVRKPFATRPAVVLSFPERDRRREIRRPVQGKAILTLVDGANSGATYDISTRDSSSSGISFLLKDALSVGQNCRVEIAEGSRSKTYLCEVIRSRPLSNGRHEMAVQFRKAM